AYGRGRQFEVDFRGSRYSNMRDYRSITFFTRNNCEFSSGNFGERKLPRVVRFRRQLQLDDLNLCTSEGYAIGGYNLARNLDGGIGRNGTDGSCDDGAKCRRIDSHSSLRRNKPKTASRVPPEPSDVGFCNFGDVLRPCQ